MTRREFGFFGSLAATRFQGATITEPKSRTLLLVDDYHILYRSGTHRKVRPLKKYQQNPVLAGRVKPWEIDVGWNSCYRDPDSGTYKLWYQAYSGKLARERTKTCVVCYAESPDGVRWNRPALNLFDYNGIKDTNIVLTGNGGHSSNYGASVIVTPHDPDKARRYKMAYFDWSFQGGREYPGLSVAFSSDGVHWNKHPEAPLLRASYGTFGERLPYGDEAGREWSTPLAISDALYALYDPARRVYEIYSKLWIDRPDGGMYWKHAMGRTQSEDFVHWSKPEIVLAPDDSDPDWLEFHAAPVFYYNDCYFALLQILRREVKGGIIDIELATSRDGMRWERPFRSDYFLKRSEGNQFDSGSLFLDPTPIYLTEEIQFFYGGYSQGATSGNDAELISGIGLATMERDRFAGIEPVDGIGQVTLKALELSAATTLTVNTDAANGALRVEVLDAGGRRVRGFTREDAIPLRGNQPAFTPQWSSKSLKDLEAGHYMLRLHLENAKVFALNLRI